METSSNGSINITPSSEPLKKTWKNIPRQTGDKSYRISDKSIIATKARLALVKSIQRNIAEKDIQRSILDFLAAKKIFSWRNNTGGGFQSNPSGKQYFIRFSTKGAPDILGILSDGRFLAIEVKKPGGVATQNQLEFLDTIKRNKGVAFIATCIEDVVRELNL